MSKERPILFSSPMVRAILAGQKTQTRRVCKVQPAAEYAHEARLSYVADSPARSEVGKYRWARMPGGITTYSALSEPFAGYPYGQPGDRLWVRETWAVCASSSRAMDTDAPIFETVVRYAADDKERTLSTDTPRHCGSLRTDGTLAWRPSTHMPRWASRMTLEVTGVRVERLQDISEADALAEGVAVDRGNAYHVAGHEGDWAHATARGCFETLWSSINGAESWAANPWVWVVKFRRGAAESSAG